MAKPFSIQAPEDVAKEYAGNKQRIMQAAQMGIVDPTAAILAGMFIDRMRGAQMQEGASPPTVAQEVMGGLPPAPPAPSPAAGGLGALPQSGPPMAPEPAPQVPMEEAPMGMAEGGLATLSVPETMFDEPDNGGYAGGGLIAFADGGGIDPAALRRALRAQESSGDYGAVNKGSGAMGAYQFMDPTARALAKRLGIAYRPDLMSGEGGRSKEGQAYQEQLMNAQMEDIMRFSKGDPKLAAAYHFAGPNKAGWKGKTAQYQQDILRRMGMAAAEEVPAEDGASPVDFERRTPNILAGAARFREALAGNAAPETKRRDEMIAELESSLAPEAREKERSARKWEALAQFGFQLAQSPGGLLQAASAAASAVLPTLRTADKEAKAEARADRAALFELERRSNDEKRELEKLALELAMRDEGLLNDERKLELQYILANMDDKTRRAVAAMTTQAQRDISAAEITSREGIAAGDRESAERVAGIRAAAGADLDGDGKPDSLYDRSGGTQGDPLGLRN